MCACNVYTIYILTNMYQPLAEVAFVNLEESCLFCTEFRVQKKISSLFLESCGASDIIKLLLIRINYFCLYIFINI